MRFLTYSLHGPISNSPLMSPTQFLCVVWRILYRINTVILTLTCLLDIVFIMLGEILSCSLVGVEGLRPYT